MVSKYIVRRVLQSQLTGHASCAEEEIVQETSDPDGVHRNEATVPNTALIILIMA